MSKNGVHNIRVCTVDPESNYTLIRIAIEITRNREEIMKQKHERENSIDVKPYSILFINMNTIYNTSQERKSSALEAIQIAHNMVGLDVTNSPIERNVNPTHSQRS